MDEFRYNQAQMKDDIAGMKRKQNQMKVGHSLFNFTLLGIKCSISLYCMGAYLLLSRVSQCRCLIQYSRYDNDKKIARGKLRNTKQATKFLIEQAFSIMLKFCINWPIELSKLKSLLYRSTHSFQICSLLN